MIETHRGNTDAKNEVNSLKTAQRTKKTIFKKYLKNKILETRTRKERANIINLIKPWDGQELKN